MRTYRSPTNRPPKVVIVLRAIPHYRVPFLDLLRADLAARGIRLSVVYGQVGPERVAKRDTVVLSWGIRIENRVIAVGSGALYWQPCLELVRDADLVIVTQEAKLLTNYVLHWRRARGRIRLAYWGHGGTYQQGPLPWLIQAIKAHLARQVDWWFAYTELSAQAVFATGFPRERLTVVNNAIDTASLRATRMSLTAEDLERERRLLGIRGQSIGVFIGGMYREKRLEFLLAACEVTKARIPDFECLFVGDGPDSGKVREAAARFPWIHFLGPRFGAEKVAALALGEVMLMPGLVGLAVLDSFALELPILTTDIPYHSPEINYLRNGENGVVLPRDCGPEEYGEQVAGLIGDDHRLSALRAGCREAAGRYTIDDMASRFASGVVQALESAKPPKDSPPTSGHDRQLGDH